MEERFWRQYWDKGMDDIDPALFDTTYTSVIRPAFIKFPDRTAFAYMGRRVSYTDFDTASNRFANMLLASGVQKGDVVSINLPNMPEYLIA